MRFLHSFTFSRAICTRLPFPEQSLTNRACISLCYDNTQLSKQDSVYGMHNLEYLSDINGCAYEHVNFVMP